MNEKEATKMLLDSDMEIMVKQQAKIRDLESRLAIAVEALRDVKEQHYCNTLERGADCKTTGITVQSAERNAHPKRKEKNE